MLDIVSRLGLLGPSRSRSSGLFGLFGSSLLGPRARGAGLGTVLTAFGLGAAVVALSGRDGRRRRAVMRDKLIHGLHEVRDAADVSARDLGNRARGAAAGVKGAIAHSREHVDDETLIARARARLGHVCTHPHAVHIIAKDGVLDISGPILRHEHDRLINAVRLVRGVKDVIDHLDVHSDSAHIPGLQGEGRRPELMPRGWTPAMRLVAGGVGAALVGWGITTRGLVGVTVGSLGALLLGRAVTNLEVPRLIGVGGRRGVEVQKTLHVHAPVDVVYERFAQLESFPRFMSHVKEVRKIGDDVNQRFHWRVEGPLGIPAEWEAILTRVEPNRLLAWKSIEGSMVENAGSLRFEEEPDGTTRLTIHLSYNPPAGAVGHVIAKLFGRDPKKLLDDDLLRFQSLIEVGKATGSEGQVRSDQVGGPSTVH